VILGIWDKDCVQHLYIVGNTLKNGLEEIGYSTQGTGVRFVLNMSDNEQKYFLKRMREEGILINRPITPTLSHSEGHVQVTLKAAKKIREELLSMNEERLAKTVQDIEMKVLFRQR
jgi:hypothetical protein